MKNIFSIRCWHYFPCFLPMPVLHSRSIQWWVCMPIARRLKRSISISIKLFTIKEKQFGTKCTSCRVAILPLPDLITNQTQQRMRVEFFNNDLTKTFNVVLEGINAAGKMTRVGRTIDANTKVDWHTLAGEKMEYQIGLFVTYWTYF